MAFYGYARVSSLDQDLAIQEEKLRTAGCQLIRAEKRSGAGRDGRTELQLLLDFLHQGDTLVVTRIDRLARLIPPRCGACVRRKGLGLRRSHGSLVSVEPRSTASLR